MSPRRRSPTIHPPSEAARAGAEFLGTALLLSVVVGSGIATSVDGALSTQLFQHAVAVGVALVALIVVFGPVSGAHLNPVVTAAAWWYDRLPTGRAVRYVTAQLVGAVTGVVVTNATFGGSALAVADIPRDGLGLVASEAIATAGLLLVIIALVRTDRVAAIPGAVGAWVGAAIFSTASACFANPAVTAARVLTDSWTGIAPASVPGFLLGQAAGLAAALTLAVWLYGPRAAPTPADAARRRDTLPAGPPTPTATPTTGADT